MKKKFTAGKSARKETSHAGGLRELLLGADAGAAFSSASRAASSPTVEKQPPMSVDDFRRLVRELYLESPKTLDAEPIGTGYNVAVLVDTSGSMEHHDPQLAKLKGALTQLVVKLAGYGARGLRINFCLIGFSEKITLRYTVTELAVFAENASDPLYCAIHALNARGGTNYEAAFRAAGAWFESCGEAAADLIYFITDGKPTCYYHDSFTHCVPAGKSGMYVCNGTEFSYSGKGRSYYDGKGCAISSNSKERRYRASEDGSFEVRVGSSLNWSEAKAVFTPRYPARHVKCVLDERYAPGLLLYYDAAGNLLSGSAGASYRVSAGGNFEQLRKGAWREPDGMVFASIQDDEGVMHANLSTKVLGGNGIASGILESGKSALAYREMGRKARRLSLFALGIGGAVDITFLNLFDSLTQAQVLSDVSQLTAALTGLVNATLASHDLSSAGAHDAASTVPHDAVSAYHAGEGAGASDADMIRAASGGVGEDAVLPHTDTEPLMEPGNGFLADSSEFIDTAFSGRASPHESVTVVRHFNLGTDHLDLSDVLGTRETMDDLLARITAGQEVRAVNGEEVSDLVLQIHSGNREQDPIIQTIVLEGFRQLNPDAPDDTHFLLQQLLYG